jgi:hypothetical protein
MHQVFHDYQDLGYLRYSGTFQSDKNCKMMPLINISG